MANLRLVWILVWVATLIPVARDASAQGLAISGIGPVNQSMGGASTASPIESSGALMWNAATISALPTSEVSFGVSLALPSAEISSRVILGPAGPPPILSGSDESESGASPIPNIAFVERVEDSAWSYGLGVFGIGGFRVNYPASVTNPVLTPPPPQGVGVGRILADVEILQIIPTLAYEVNDRFSVGFAPTVTMAKIAADPLLFAAPDDANGDTFANYPSGRGNRYSWGGGFQLGAYYITENCWHYGVGFKSPQWFEKFRFKTEDEIGRPRTEKVEFTYPTIVTVGTAYSGFENWLFALDARLFDYGNARGFRETGFNPDGSLAGLGWSSIFALCAGTQYKVSDTMYFRVGYSYNQNPISDSDASFNIASPVITQHFANIGGSFQFSSHSYLSATYTHGFENDVSGRIETPAGPVPGSRVTSKASLDAVSIGVTVRY